MTSPDTTGEIRIAVIIGTSRPGSYTARAAALLVDELQQNGGIRFDVIDPTGLALVFPGTGQRDDAVRAMGATVKHATGVIIATPEYHGTFPALLKLIIENLEFPSALAGKPVGLLGVAAGRIGAIKSLEHLRSVCSHVGAVVLPGPVSVARVQTVFDEAGNCMDAAIERQIRGMVSNLIDYIRDSICPEAALEATVRGGG
jgi:FMN reductase